MQHLQRHYLSWNAPPHISMCRFPLPPGNLNRVKELLHPDLSCEISGLKTNGLRHFAQHGTLYLSVGTCSALEDYRGTITGLLRHEFPALKRHMTISTEVHLTLGRKLTKEELLKAEQIPNPFSDPMAFTISELRLMLELDGKMKQVHRVSLKN
ncbi:MAG TPA: 2'-5' RNA ligase family protein [Bacteroidia bacterium]|nr:2'-5' RNA ligase family protein [Bacteroidia bacterium]